MTKKEIDDGIIKFNADDFLKTSPLTKEEILEIESMFVEGVINKAEADMLYNHFVYEKHMFGGGMFIEINGAYYGITFTKAYRCVKSVGKTLGCLVASRSVACVYSDDAKEIVKSCRLKKLN